MDGLLRWEMHCYLCYLLQNTRLTQAGSLGTRILDSFFNSTLSAMHEGELSDIFCVYVP